TITDKSGRILSGQTIEAFWYSVRHLPLLSIGLNCAFGAQTLRPYIQSLSDIADVNISIHPNAGLPDELGNYQESPQYTADVLAELADDGLVNIIGGCCGTTAEHIRCMTQKMQGLKPRIIPEIPIHTRLAGLEPLDIRPESLFSNVGERTNVAGSLKFKKLIKNEKYEAALEVARQQVNNGAQIIDVNMDESLLDSEQAMQTFLRCISVEPDISRVPVMIDSSKWSVIETGLKCIQGKPIVNSLSLKEGEEIFIHQAKIVKKYGAAIIVMAFDESGQADTFERRLQICNRAYDLLTKKAGILPVDIIFDPNIFAIATGMPEHNSYAADYINAVKHLKERYPHSLVSGGVSNVSFSFRGNNALRESIHSVFLYHAIKAGMDMGIVNAGQLAIYEDIPNKLRIAIENVILNHSAESADHLILLATNYSVDAFKKDQIVPDEWRMLPVLQRIIHSMVNGLDHHIQDDLEEIRADFTSTLDIVEGPLMDGMKKVGELFGAGKMFLPQVVKSARVMKKAVAHLEPYLIADKSGSKSVKGKIVMATVKGDVHDIGKNIVSVVLECNNYQIIDLGVMVNADRIIDAAIEEKADMVGLSGLITPSLDEMVHVAKEMKRLQLNVPLLIGGATTSARHTAVRIAPEYDNPVVHVLDASRSVSVVDKLLNPELCVGYQQNNLEKQAELVASFDTRQLKLVSYKEAYDNRLTTDWGELDISTPEFIGKRTIESQSLDRLRDFIDWTPFFMTWQLKGKYPRIFEHKTLGTPARELFEHAQQLLDDIISKQLFRATAVYGFWPATSVADDIIVYTDESRSEQRTIFHALRQQTRRKGQDYFRSLADYVAPLDSNRSDYIGAFALTTGIGVAELVAE
ncbi:MAG: methionine synthase, partial [Calditrichaeota bacterium]|nr:methionine synthase [Calditrichota bacterium]